MHNLSFAFGALLVFVWGIRAFSNFLFQIKVLLDLLFHFFLVFFYICSFVDQIRSDSFIFLFDGLSLLFLVVPVTPRYMLKRRMIILVKLDIRVHFPYFLQQNPIFSFDFWGFFSILKGFGERFGAVESFGDFLVFPSLFNHMMNFGSRNIADFFYVFLVFEFVLPFEEFVLANWPRSSNESFHQLIKIIYFHPANKS